MKKYKYTNMAVLILLSMLELTAMPVYADVTEYQEPGMDMEEVSAECEVVYRETYDFSETIPKYPETLDATATGYEGVYDGKLHGITVRPNMEGAAILYSTDGEKYTAEKPMYADVGTYTIYYKVEKEGYTAVTGSATVRITEAAIGYTSSDYSGLYDGREHSISLLVHTDGCRSLYSEDGVNFTSKKPAYKEAGTYVVYYKLMKDNYATVTGSNKVIIGNRVIGFTSNDYVGTYDGKPHGIEVSVSTDGCELLYSTDGINYTSQKPEYKEAGTYVTYFKIRKEGYETVSGSNRVVIRPKAGTAGSDTDGYSNGSTGDRVSDVQTGDNSHILAFAMMLLLSGAGLIKSNQKKKEEKDHEDK